MTTTASANASSVPSATGEASVLSDSSSTKLAGGSCRVVATTTVTEGRGGITHAIAANDREVVVTFGEKRSGGDEYVASGAKQRFELARSFDARTLAPLGPAKEMEHQSAVDGMSNGAAPFVLNGGPLGVATCAWAAFAGKLQCDVAPAPNAALGATAATFRADVPGPGPLGERIAAIGVGDHALIILPQCEGLRIYSTGTKSGHEWGGAALTECGLGKGIETPALAPLPSDQAAVAFRLRDRIELLLLASNGEPIGKEMAVSPKGAEVGAPALVYAEGAVQLAYASRVKGKAYGIMSTRWIKGAEPTHRPLVFEAEPTMAPSLAPLGASTGCHMLAFTQGAGERTRARAGLVCDGSLVSTSLIDLSTPGVEAGDAELAGSKAGTFAVVQELPKGKPPELHLVKLECAI